MSAQTSDNGEESDPPDQAENKLSEFENEASELAENSWAPRERFLCRMGRLAWLRCAVPPPEVLYDWQLVKNRWRDYAVALLVHGHSASEIHQRDRGHLLSARALLFCAQNTFNNMAAFSLVNQAELECAKVSFADFHRHLSRFESWEADLDQALENYHGTEYKGAMRKERDQLREQAQEAESLTIAFSAGDIRLLRSFASRLRAPVQTDGVSTFLSTVLSAGTKELLKEHETAWGPELERALLDDLNKIISGGLIYEADRFKNVKLSKTTQELLNRKPGGNDLMRLNRFLLGDAYLELSQSNQGAGRLWLRLLEAYSNHWHLVNNREYYTVLLTRRIFRTLTGSLIVAAMAVSLLVAEPKSSGNAAEAFFRLLPAMWIAMGVFGAAVSVLVQSSSKTASAVTFRRNLAEIPLRLALGGAAGLVTYMSMNNALDAKAPLAGLLAAFGSGFSEKLFLSRVTSLVNKGALDADQPNPKPRREGEPPQRNQGRASGGKPEVKNDEAPH